MKRIVWMCLMLLCAAGLLHAGDMTSDNTLGTVCDKKCVYQQASYAWPRAACSKHCTENSGMAVFIDDQGRAHGD